MASTGSKIQGMIIEIGGDTSKLKQSLKDVDTELSKTTGQLKEVNKLLKLDPTNITLIEQKYGYLSEAITQTTDKLNLLKSVQSEAKEKGVDTESENYKALVREIEATEINLKRLNDERTNTINTVEQLGAKLDKLTDEQREEAKAAKEAGKAQKENGKEFKAGLQNAKNWIVIIEKVIKAVIKVAKEITNLAKTAADAAKEVQKLAKQTDLSVQQVQELSYVSKIAGVNLDVITKTVKQNLKSMKEAAKYNWDYMEGYDALGVSIYDANGELRDSGEVYWDVITALREMEESTQRDIIAETLLGRKASELNELFSLSNEEFNKFIKEANELGAVLDEGAIDKLNSLSNEFIKVQASMTAAKNALILELSGTLTYFSEMIVQAIQNLRNVIQGGDAFTGITQWLVDSLGKLINHLLKWIETQLPTFLPELIKMLFNLVGQILDALADFKWLDFVFELTENLAVTIMQELPNLFFKILDAAQKLSMNLVENLFKPEFWETLGKAGRNMGRAIINGLIGVVEAGINSIIKPISWLLSKVGVKMKEGIKIPRIPMLAKGGIVGNGGSAIVGEAGAELLSVNQGKATVQPLTANVNTQQLAAALGSTNTTQTININFTGSLSQLARILQPEITRETERYGTSLLK